jgi:heptaprenyl diphosphate synthase
LSTLYHDDVIDQAETRRGVASVNARWGARLAVAAGDRLTALALAEAADGGPGVPRALARTYARLVEGERLETAVVGRLDAGTDTYLAVIEAKTASLLATAAEVGAWAGGAGAGSRQALSAWGRDLGLAFQVADDLLDLTGDSRAAGKPVGRDLALGVYTWPILDALATPAGWRLRTVLAGTPPHPAPTVEEAMRIVRESGAIGRAERLVHRLLDRAERSLRRLPATPAAAALGDLGRTLTPAPAQPALTAVSG